MGVELVRLSGPVSVSQASAITLGDIKGYMTGKYDTAWWLVVRVCHANRPFYARSYRDFSPPPWSQQVISLSKQAHQTF